MSSAIERPTDRPAPTVIGGIRPAPPLPPATSGARALRVAILDEQRTFLDAAAAWFPEHTSEFELALTATTWLELVHSPAFPTDLVVLDGSMRGPVSVEARVRTCRAAGATVIVLAASPGRDRTPTPGVAAVLPRTTSLADVLAVAADAMRPGPDQHASRPWRPLPVAADTVVRPKLSLGEERALRLYVAGSSTNEVAIAMHVQFETAKTYLRRVREKYARAGRPAGRRTDLMRRAAEDGYVD